VQAEDGPATSAFESHPKATFRLVLTSRSSPVSCSESPAVSKPRGLIRERVHSHHMPLAHGRQLGDRKPHRHDSFGHKGAARGVAAHLPLDCAYSAWAARSLIVSLLRPRARPELSLLSSVSSTRRRLVCGLGVATVLARRSLLSVAATRSAKTTATARAGEAGRRVLLLARNRWIAVFLFSAAFLTARASLQRVQLPDPAESSSFAESAA
jgi:hypothetical protein